MACPSSLHTCRHSAIAASNVQLPGPAVAARLLRSGLSFKGLPLSIGCSQGHVTCHGRSQGLRCREEGWDLPLLDVAHDIDAQALAAETPRLLALCRDLDLNLQISTLRRQARSGLHHLTLQAVYNYIDSWSHDHMVQRLEEHWNAKLPTPEAPWNVELAMQDLRLQASRQAVHQLARDLDSSFNWETAATELQRHVRQQSHPRPCESLSTGDGLWNSWIQANEEMILADNRLMQDALAVSADLNEKEHLLHLRSGFQDMMTKTVTDLPTIAVAAAASLNAMIVDAASAAETGFSIQPLPESVEAATRAPSWLPPAVLAFPVVTYLLFNYYREQVNPGARVVDWMFGVMAAVIVANLVLIATLGVRLY